MWKYIALGLFFSTLVVLVSSCEQGGSFHECKLRQDLFTPGKPCLKECLPRNQPDKPVQVSTAVILQQVVNVDEVSQLTTVHVFLQMYWNSTVTWQKDEYGGIESIGLHSSSMWVPDIMLFSAVKVEQVHSDVLLVQYNTGYVTFVPQLIITTPCVFDTYRFPFDAHTCTMSLGSWIYMEDQLLIVASDRDSEQTKLNYRSNSAWDVNILQQDTVLTGSNNTTFISLIFEFELKRYVELYSFVLLLPGVLLNALSLVVFYVPPTLSDKLAISLSIFLSYFLLLTILMGSVPSAGARIPLLGQYYMTSCITNFLIICCSIVVLNVHDKSHKQQPFPARYVGMLRWYAAMFCMVNNEAVSSGNQVIELSEGKEQETTSNRSWTMMARLLDRVFFLLFLAVTVLSAVTFSAKIMI